jgi:PhnB protein
MKRSKAKRTTKAKSKSKPKATKKKVQAIPPGFRTVTPHLVVRNAKNAIAFYKSAFGAKEKMVMPTPDGGVAHAELKIGDSLLMVADEMPAMGASAPQTVGGSPVHIFLYVPNVDKVFAQAVKAGATVTMPLMDMFWGDRYGKLDDPFGHKWALATHVEDVSPREMAKRAEKAAAEGRTD